MPPATKTYEVGADVRLETTAAGDIIDGYRFSGWSSSDAELSEIGFIMPDHDVTLHGSFERASFQICYAFDGTVLPPNHETLLPACESHYPGDTVSLAAEPIADEYDFTTWNTDDLVAVDEDNNFTMPSHNVSIKGAWVSISGKFTPQITLQNLEPKAAYMTGETVKFKITITNPADYPIQNVFIEEQLAGAKFTASADDYTIKSDAIALIPQIAAGASVDLYAEYFITEDANKTITNPVQLIGAIAADGYILDDSKDYTASADFQTIPEPAPLTGIILGASPYLALILLGTGALIVTILLAKRKNQHLTPAKSFHKPTHRLALSKFSARHLATFSLFSAKPIRYALPALTLILGAGSIMLIQQSFATDIAPGIAPSYDDSSITLESQNTDFCKQGSWRVTKSAQWTSANTARITFAINTLSKSAHGTDQGGGSNNPKKAAYSNDCDGNGRSLRTTTDGTTDRDSTTDGTTNRDSTTDITPTDLVIALSFSSDSNLATVKSSLSNFISGLLEREDSRIALVSFNSEAAILSDFSNDSAALISSLDGIETSTNISYYAGLVKVEELLQNYEAQSGRNLATFFLTDSQPTKDSPSETAEYRVLKQLHPNMRLSGISYQLESNPQLEQISDHHYYADRFDFPNTLLTALDTPYTYQNFTITDYIKDAYWELSGADAIQASLGDVDFTYDNTTPVITWNMANVLESGNRASLTIDITLKPGVDINSHEFFETNIRTRVSSTLHDTPAEDITTTTSPKLQSSYKVSYDANLPGSCSESTAGTLPETVSYPPYSIVQKSTSQLTCPGYNFNGWAIATNSVAQSLNDDYFRLLSSNVTLRAIWSKPSITKSLEGEINREGIATLKTGKEVNLLLKQTYSEDYTSYSNTNRAITKIKRADSITIDQQQSAKIISTADSPIPVYAWYDSTDSTTYIYSDAKIIEANTDSSDLFYRFSGLADISGVSDWDMSKVTDMSHMFSETSALTNIDGAANWNTSKVTNMSYMFKDASALTNIDGAANWNTSKVTSMEYMFNDASALTNIDGATGWDTSQVTSMYAMFSGASALTNIDGAANWDTSSVRGMGWMFSVTPALTNIDGAANWDTSSVRGMDSMFYVASALANIDGAANWNTSSVTDMNSMFEKASALTNIDALTGWNTSEVTDMNSMFSGASALANIDGAANWNTTKVTNIKELFKNASSITDLSPLNNWNTTSLTDQTDAFAGIPDSVARPTWYVGS